MRRSRVAEAEPIGIPETPAGLDAAWLTAALRRGGVLEHQTVVGVESEPLGEGVGFLGQLLRLRLRYDGQGAGPQTLIAKLPNLENRAMGEMLGAYERENCFYMSLAEQVPLATPRMYYGDFDRDRASEKQEQVLRVVDRIPRWLIGPTTGLARRIAAGKKRRYILLLEDLGEAAEPVDQLAGTTTRRAAEVLRAVARLHARFWNAPLEKRFWLLPLDIDGRMRNALFRRSLPSFGEFFGADLEARLAARLGQLAESGGAVLASLMRAPATLLHYDLRLDNLFFREHEVVFFDWQLVRRGPAAWDVAYFLSGALDEGAGSEAIRELLAGYHAELRAGKVDGYEFEDLARDYRLALEAVLQHLAVVDQVELGGGRGVALLTGWMRRLASRLREAEQIAPAERSVAEGGAA